MKIILISIMLLCTGVKTCNGNNEPNKTQTSGTPEQLFSPNSLVQFY